MTAQLVLDPQLAAAVEIAREALLADVPESSVGEHLGVEADAELVATHLFECLDKAYVGWRWAVTVTRVDQSDYVTVNESVLLPGEQSLIAPEWLPWQDRVQPGDLGVGDVLPTQPEDLRLVPGYTGSDLDDTEDDDLVPVLWELGLGRVRVLSAIGRDQAADRWSHGDNGPDSPIARAASEQCSTCGFLLPMAGPLGRAFGICANEFAPSDGQVVTLDHGCGAHSEAEPEPVPVPVVELVVDDLGAQVLDTAELTEAETAEPEAETEAAAEPATEAPAVEEQVTEEQVTEAPIAEGPVAAEPAAEEPTTEEPTANETTAEELAADEPATGDEPAVADTEATEATAESGEVVGEAVSIELEPSADEPHDETSTDETTADEPQLETVDEQDNDEQKENQ